MLSPSTTLPLPKQHQRLQSAIEHELEGIDAIFREQLASDVLIVNDLCEHVAHYRGKMLRPILTLLSGLAAFPDSDASAYATDAERGSRPSLPAHTESADSRRLTQAHRTLAAVCEMIHMATLVHDDVLDDAQMRRSGRTVNCLRGNEAAVLLGDYLISNAFHLCSTLGRPEINRRIGEVTNDLCSGELLQVHHRENWSIDERTYFAIIEHKTASLIGLCCELGANESGAAPEVVRALKTFGRRVGVAFQIQDDLLDLTGEEVIVGKSLGRDLQKGKLTLPVIRCFRSSPPALRSELIGILNQITAPRTNERAFVRMRQLLEQTGAVADAQNVSRRLIDEARAELSILPDSPACALLDDLATAVISRSF